MNTDLDPKEIIAWHIDRAKFHTQMAEALKREYHQGSYFADSITSPLGGSSSGKFNLVSRNQIQDVIKVKSKRVGDLAKELNADPKQILATIENDDSGMVIGEKGWIRMKQ